MGLVFEMGFRFSFEGLGLIFEMGFRFSFEVILGLVLKPPERGIL